MHDSSQGPASVVKPHHLKLAAGHWHGDLLLGTRRFLLGTSTHGCLWPLLYSSGHYTAVATAV
jgi:hypothetical protein